MTPTSAARLAASLAAIPLLLPNISNSLYGAEPASKRMSVAERPVAHLRTVDVIFQSGNVLTGRVQDADGAIIPNAEILVTQANREIARTTATESGEFAVTLPKGGIYLVTSGDRLQLVRVWTTKAAPPNSQNELVLAPSTIVVRGQNPSGLFGMNPGVSMFAGLVIGAGVATAIAVPVALNNADNSSNPATPANKQLEIKPPATP